jgi:hypothetical protein
MTVGDDLGREKELKSLLKLEFLVMVVFALGAVSSLIVGVFVAQPLAGLGGFFLLGLLAALVFMWRQNNQQQLDELPLLRQRRREQAEVTMKGLAREHQGTLVVDELGFPSFSTVIGGQATEFRATEFNIVVSSTMPMGSLRLFICPQAQVNKQFSNVVDVQIGNRGFDNQFAIQTNDTGRARSFLNGRIPSAIQDLAAEVAPEPFGVTFNNGEVHLAVPFIQSSKEKPIQACLALLEVIQQEVGIWSGKAVLDILPAKTTEDEASCLVCGDLVVKQKVQCLRCRTAHHRECWDYIGHCSVFGCGSKEFRNHM